MITGHIRRLKHFLDRRGAAVGAASPRRDSWPEKELNSSAALLAPASRGRPRLLGIHRRAAPTASASRSLLLLLRRLRLSAGAAFAHQRVKGQIRATLPGEAIPADEGELCPNHRIKAGGLNGKKPRPWRRRPRARADPGHRFLISYKPEIKAMPSWGRLP